MDELSEGAEISYSEGQAKGAIDETPALGVKKMQSTQTGQTYQKKEEASFNKLESRDHSMH